MSQRKSRKTGGQSQSPQRANDAIEVFRTLNIATSKAREQMLNQGVPIAPKVGPEQRPEQQLTDYEFRLAGASKWDTVDEVDNAELERDSQRG